MPNPKRNHSREFKLECCRQAATGGKRPAQLCREHNLSESVYCFGEFQEPPRAPLLLLEEGYL